MNLIKIVLILTLISGCALITRKVDPNVKTDQVVYSEAGGVASWFTGKISSCTILRSSEDEMEIVTLIFDEDTCAVELKGKDDGTN